MYSELDRWLTAICLYREASNQSYSAILGKAFVIRNRALRKSWEGDTTAEVVTKPGQFDGMVPPIPEVPKVATDGKTYEETLLDHIEGLNRTIANLSRWNSNPEDKAWLNCTLAAQAACIDPPIGRDLSCGAEFYFDYPANEPPKEWGPVKLTAVIDGTKFWARDETVPKEQTT